MAILIAACLLALDPEPTPATEQTDATPSDALTVGSEPTPVEEPVCATPISITPEPTHDVTPDAPQVASPTPDVAVVEPAESATEIPVSELAEVATEQTTPDAEQTEDAEEGAERLAAESEPSDPVESFTQPPDPGSTSGGAKPSSDTAGASPSADASSTPSDAATVPVILPTPAPDLLVGIAQPSPGNPAEPADRGGASLLVDPASTTIPDGEVAPTEDPMLKGGEEMQILVVVTAPSNAMVGDVVTMTVDAVDKNGN